MKWFKFVGVIALIVTLVLLQRKFYPEKVLVTKTVIKYSVHDSIQWRSKLVPYAVEVPGDTVKIPADTAELIRRYKAVHKELFTVREYRDTFKVDTIGNIKVYQKITQNKLDSMSVTPYLVIPHTYTTTTITESPKNQWYIGGSTDFKGVGPALLFDNKGKKSYFVSYDLVQKKTTVGVLVNLNKIKLW